MINPYESYDGMTIPNYGKSTSRGPPTPSYIHGMTRWFPNKKYWDFTIKHVNPVLLKATPRQNIGYQEASTGLTVMFQIFFDHSLGVYPNLKQTRVP